MLAADDDVDEVDVDGFSLGFFAAVAIDVVELCSGRRDDDEL